MIADCYKPPSNLTEGSVVWAYLRDSGGDTQERSVGQQENVIREYCSEYGLVLDHIFCDEARSGGSLRGREQFQLMMEKIDLGRSKPDGILVWNNARFGRNVQDSMFHRSKIRMKKIVFHSLSDPIPEGNVGIVTEAVIDYSNQEKREQMSRDIKRGMRDQLRKGFQASGNPPRGYRVEYIEVGQLRNGKPRIVPKWVPDPELWDLCKLAWDMRVEGYSYSEIHKATGIYKSKKCFNTFFKNRTYLGIATCGELEIAGHHEAMISKEIWEKVQAMRYGDPRYAIKINAPRRISNPSLLSGLAKCAYCGDAMVISRDRRKNWGCYKCGRKNRMGKESCQNRQINAKKVDALVLNTVLDRILTLDFVLSIFKRVREEVSGSENLQQQIERVRNEEKFVEKKVERLLEMGMFQGVSEQIGKKLKDCDVQARRLKVERRGLEAKLKASRLEISNLALIRVLERWREQISQAKEADDLARLRKILSNIVRWVEMGYNPEGERITRIFYQFPIDESSLSASGHFAAGSTFRLPELFPMAVGSWALEVDWVEERQRC